jgi:hypothetical protein
MEKKFVIGTGIWAGIAIIGIVFLAVFYTNIFYNQTTGDARTGTKIVIPNVNIKEVAYTVSTDKPGIAIAKFAEASDSGEKTGTELTIYNQGFALAKEKRSLFLKQGVNVVKYKDVASQIDPTSVMFRDLGDASTIVLEQNYEYDLVSKTKLLEKYLDRQITVQATEGTGTKEYSGTLLSYEDGIMLQTLEGVVSITNPERISFPELPEGLLTKPTLVWHVFANSEGTRNTETTYLTNGMNWRADYIAKVNPDDSAMGFSGWVTTTNNSGTAYPDTKLKLVAGDIHKISEGLKYGEIQDKIRETAPSAANGGFTQEALFEYHMYTLERKTDILNNETKQISLLAAENVPVTKELVYNGAENGTKVQIKLNFKNSDSQGLGMPLPKGIVRVYKEDSSGQLQFVGEDQIDHTAKDEKVRLYLGDAFDIVGERKTTESTNLSPGYYKESYEIILRNHKDTEQEVIIEEYAGSSWTVTQKSDSFTQKDAYNIEFKVKVPANGEKRVTYTIEHRYYW